MGVRYPVNLKPEKAQNLRSKFRFGSDAKLKLMLLTGNRSSCGHWAIVAQPNFLHNRQAI